MNYTYAVLGGGRQGTAAAYDMAKFGDAKKVLVADINQAIAIESAARVNDLLGSEIAEGRQLDATNQVELVEFLTEVDSFLSAVPYWLNPAITRAAAASLTCCLLLLGNYESGTSHNDRSGQNAITITESNRIIRNGNVAE